MFITCIACEALLNFESKIITTSLGVLNLWSFISMHMYYNILCIANNLHIYSTMKEAHYWCRNGHFLLLSKNAYYWWAFSQKQYVFFLGPIHNVYISVYISPLNVFKISVDIFGDTYLVVLVNLNAYKDLNCFLNV